MSLQLRYYVFFGLVFDQALKTSTGEDLEFDEETMTNMGVGSRGCGDLGNNPNEAIFITASFLVLGPEETVFCEGLTHVHWTLEEQPEWRETLKEFCSQHGIANAPEPAWKVTWSLG